MLSELEKRIIAAVQGDIPVTSRPYRPIAEKLGIDEDTLLEALKGLVRRGVIRRFGATLRHQNSGFEANAMTAWQVDEDQIERVGKIMAAFRQVSHCYRRDPTVQWPYNLYTMIHGTSEVECRKTARHMAEKTGIDTYRLLFSKKELKKVSMQYFPSDQPPV